MKRHTLLISAVLVGLLGLAGWFSPVSITAQQAGGAFVPSFNYRITGLWTFTQTPTFLSGSGQPAATSPSFTANGASPNFVTAAGTANTGKVVINGKTSGSTTYTTADATAQALTVNTAAQTSGAATLTIPDQAGVSRNIATNPTPTAGLGFTNATSGTITIGTPTGALGTPTLLLPTGVTAANNGLPAAYSCGSTGSGSQTCTITAANGLTKIYNGSSTLASNTATITFNPAFTSATSYFCVANDVTTRANPVQMVPSAGATAVITNTTGATDVIQWICAGQ